MKTVSLLYNSVYAKVRTKLIIVMGVFIFYFGSIHGQTATQPPGAGTYSNPYLISTLDHLYWLSQTPSAWASGKYFEQVSNIDASSTITWNNGQGLSPIGRGSAFLGNYNGRNYSITGLYINRPTENNTALFSTVTLGKLINLRLENVNVTGSGYTGAMVGQLSDTLLNCVSSGTVKGNSTYVGGLVGVVGSGGRVYHSGSSVNVENTGVSNKIGTGGLIGGISGGSVYNCYALGNVKGPIQVGGFIGSFESVATTVDCFARGSVEAVFSHSGGFAGREPATGSSIVRCYSTGAVIGPASRGGLVAGNTVLTEQVLNSFWDTQTSGMTVSMGGTGRTTAQMKTNSTFTDSGWNFTTVWDRSDLVNNGYPSLRPYNTALPPIAVTGSATLLAPKSATLNGMVNPNGFATKVIFEYDTTTSYSRKTDTLNAGSGSISVPFNTQISNLKPGKLYHYRIKAFNSSGTTVGLDSVFTTPAQPTPFVQTLQADSVGIYSLRLRGRVSAMGDSTKYYFEYTVGSVVTRTDTIHIGSSFDTLTVTKYLTGLLPNAAYSYRIIAFNAGGSASGNIVQFTTSQTQPSVVTGPAEPVYQTVAYITGSVNPAGLSTKAVVDYGSTVSYGFVSDTVDVGSAVVPAAVTIKLTGLTPGTQYHFRLRLIRADGSYVGLDSVFITRTNPVAVAPLGTGTYINPRRITSLENLLWISQNSSTWSSYFLQVNDIDAAATKYWYDGAGFPTIGVPTTGRFGGIYAGQGYKIKNLYINRPENSSVALMADISGYILDLNIVDAFVKGKSSVGILAGTLSGTIINCNTSGTVEGTTNSMGGLVGYNSSAGRISYSSSSANVYGDTISSVSVGGLVGTHYQGQITNSFATGNVTGFTRTGGLAGDQSNATLKNSYARGNVYAALSRAGGLIGLLSGSPTVSNTYSTGSVTAPSIYGGLVGIFSNPAAPVFVANFWDEESSGISTSAVGYPRSTLQMKTNSTFIDSNWNWGVDWSREPNINDGYPYLVQMPPILPTIVTNGATSVGITTATLRATGKANAVQAWGYFDYGTTSNYGMRSDTVELGWAMFNVAVTRNLTGLQPNTQYHYRFVAYNADTIAYGLDSMFTTMPAPAPFAATVRADNITSTSARLNGVLNANGFATQYYFEYKTGSIVKRTDTLSAGSGTTNDTVRITVNGLSPFSIYTYKIIAFNSGASSSGADSSFATPAPPITPPPGTGTQADPYLISTLNHLYWLSMTPAAWVAGKYFEQIADIDASQTVDWDSGRGYLPIALNSIFYGRYDGKNHTISGLNINRPTTDKIGLFSSTQSGSLSNITLTNVTISGFGLVGGLVGRNLSELTNCKTSGSVKGNGNYVGGLVGINSLGTIAYCSSSADVLNTSTLTSAGGIAGSIAFSTLKNSYATGNTKANLFAGGLVGNIESGVTIENCYARGRAEAVSGYAGGLGGYPPSPSSGSAIKNSYSTGLVIAPSNKGGLIPPSTVAHLISASFWDTETSGISTSGGGNGKTTAQMKTTSTFTDSGWNFTTIWRRVDSINNGYPYLLPPQVPAPLVTTLKADNITSTGARLNGVVNANGLATQYYFEYKTGSTTKRTDTLSTGSGTTNDTVRISVSGLSPSSIYSHKIVAYNSGGSTSGGDSSFTTLSLPVPVVFTGSPINVMPKSATVSAKVNPNGLLTKAVFEYDTTTAYTKKSDTLTVGSGDTLVSISSLLNNLKPNTLYHYRVKAFNSSGTAEGLDSAFTTPIQPKPFVQTLQADSVGIYSLRLRGKVNAMGDSTRYYFEYTVGSVAARTDTIYVGNSFDTITVTKYLTGLFPNSAYSYRIIAFNSAGSSQGSLLGSTTLMPPKPIVFTGSANPILQTSARLHGTINAQGDSTRWYFEYGLTTSYGMRSDTLYLGNSLNNVQVNKYILGLQPNTRYYYRVAAYNSAGLTNGAGTSFVTLAPVLALTSPVGGEGYEPGTTQNITWNASAVDTLKIEFSSDNGNTWNTVVDNQLTLGGSYNWMVPSVATTDGKIRITSKGITPEIVSMSTGVFTIAPSSLASQPTGTDQGLNGNSFPDNQNGSAVGDSGTVINTTNGGTTWVTPPAPIEGIGIRNLNDISTPSKWTRYAAGDSGTVYKTTNAGLSWNSLNTANMQNYYGIVFTDTLMGTLTGSNGTILRTTNGGGNWVAQSSGTSQSLRDIYFTNAATATAVGDTGTILFTSNGGSTWTAQNSGTMQNLHGVWFVKNAGVHQIGYAVGDSGTIVKTTNGGANWNVLLSPTSKKLNDIAFYTPERGSAVGEGGVVIYTTNGGSMWKSLVGTGSRNINSIAIPNSGGLMFLAGSNGSAFKDTVGIVPVELTSFTASNANGKVILTWVTASELNNAGFEVERAFTGASTPLSHRTPLSPSGEKVFTKIGELAGKGTTVQISEYTFIDNVSVLGTYVYRLKQKDYDGTVSYSPEVEITLDAPMEFALSQNYPNPFNPSTQIKYQLPEASDVLLEVYDIQGSLVSRLVSGKQEAGYYQVTFDAGKLSTGVYIYRLTAGKYSKTMKLMLMK